MYAVIAENDSSQWSDDTGVLYHFPKRYMALLSPGTLVIYYKGKLRDAAYQGTRLDPGPHYFGVARIGKVYPDPSSDKGDLFATIEDYEVFTKPVGIKDTANSYFEVIPENRLSNFWRDGVRTVSQQTYLAILESAGAERQGVPSNEEDQLESFVEGSKTLRYVTTYERNPRYRKLALALHGLTCKACDVDMGKRYGAYAQGLIHVHHVVPVSTYELPKSIDPLTDLVPVCPNCHAVIHRKKTATLSVADIRKLLNSDELTVNTSSKLHP